jgi:hypothetical protein
MSEEFQSTEEQIRRMLMRKERALRVIAELEQIVAEVDTDVLGMRLRLDALRYDGDSTTGPNPAGEDKDPSP